VRVLGEETARRFEVGLQVDAVQALQSAPATSPEAPVVQALSRAIKAVYGREARPQGIGGGTVAAFFRQVGLPAAVWMTVNETAHQPNEFCSLSTLVGDARVLAHVMLMAD
jgi:succinyl-diaminopimelate desuccinylase